MKNQKIYILSGIFLLFSIYSFGQQKINLANKLQTSKIEPINRIITLYGDHSNAIELNKNKGDGLGILEEIEFEKGTIEIELLGENKPGKSFIGIAFNIQNDSTYEAIYFRPFNFNAEEQIRKSHMVQYIFHPEFKWRKLRAERTGEFEGKIRNPPNPDDWFKAIINISDKKVEVYVNNLSEPALIVDRLTTIKSDKIGVWTGFESPGKFKNLVLRTR